jgi:hypothetical protein
VAFKGRHDTLSDRWRQRRCVTCAALLPTAQLTREHPDRWRLAAWDQPDLAYADAHALARYKEWDHYVPYMERVQCGDKIKPALFFKIGYADYDDAKPRVSWWSD